MSKPSNSRIKSNACLKKMCNDVVGNVLSIGSASDFDKQDTHYKDYFPNRSSYTTSEVDTKYNCDLQLDVTNMEEISDNTYDCIFCVGVLEHVFECQKGISEITRILKKGGILILGVPFNQGIHCAPTDYWRFTKFSIRKLLENQYDIIQLEEVEGIPNKFPSAYIAKGRKY